MIKGKFITQGGDLADARQVRQAVFIEEQQIDPELEYDGRDGEAVHAVVYDENGLPVGTGRLLLEDDGCFHMGRVAVKKECRRQGYGDFIVRMLLDRAFQCGANEIHILAQTTAVRFYETIGFAVCGERCLDAGIEHYPMKIKKGGVKTACGGCH